MKHDWQHILADSVTSPEELGEILSIDPEPLKNVCKYYPMRITRSYLGLISGYGDPVWLQSVPALPELDESLYPDDPLNEEELSPVSGLIHRYPDRVVWLVSNVCAVYCRFCMRKRRVGKSNCIVAAKDDVLSYIKSYKEIKDVTLSGGDPLLLPDETLEEILSDLRKIDHVEIIRIGTRVPVTLPERVTPELASLLSRYNPIYINTHFNHPVEVTEKSKRACAILADAGIPLGNQTVLLKGVNDTPETMIALMRKLLSIRVKPYYLHHMDMVKGTSHFRTTVSCGLSIIKHMRGYVSGLAVPHYVIDLPGGKGKVPILPDAARIENGKLMLTTFKGEIVEYPDL